MTQLEPPTMAKIDGIAPGGLAVVHGSGGNDVVWASDPARNRVVRIDGVTRHVVGRSTAAMATCSGSQRT